MEYYRCLGLEPKWNLDLQDLEDRFYAISRGLHPDRYARASQQERRAALDASARLNDAYRTLKDPIRRSEYLLAQLGVDGRESPELLEEAFEWNLEFEELQAGADPKKLDAARARFEALRGETDREIARHFEEYDRSGSRDALAAARSLLYRRKYLANLLCHPPRT